MKLFNSRFFIFGVLFLLLVSIPATIYFMKNQADIRSRAEKSSQLSFRPSNVSATVGRNFDLDIIVDPGENLISSVKLSIKYDASKLEAVQLVPNTAAFPTILEGPTIVAGNVTVLMVIPANATSAIQTVTKVATITFKPLAATSSPISILFNPDPETEILSIRETLGDLSNTDQTGENVLKLTTPATVTISGGTAPTITPTLTSIPISPSPTTTANNAPICSELSISPTKTGTVPFSVVLTGKGSDTDGQISKATFNFGDGQAQDVTEGLNQKSVIVQTNHTYRTSGSFISSVIFTDDKNAISSACTQTIEVSQGTGGTLTPTPTLPEKVLPTNTPTIPPPGDAKTALGIMGGVMLTILGGILLLAL